MIAENPLAPFASHKEDCELGFAIKYKKNLFNETNEFIKKMDGFKDLMNKLDIRIISSECTCGLEKALKQKVFTEFDLEQSFLAGWDKVDFEDWFKEKYNKK